MVEPRKKRHCVEFISDECRGCHLCQLACSFYKTSVFRLLDSRIKVKRDIDKIERYKVELTDACDACGKCVAWCGYGAINAK